ncbi:MAG: VWA domain-containing protein [Bacteroidetes bacterium]|nr:VWA domain-containing protein [Bacteroidota bacterium]MBT6685517.1 VWA domain-containing protein [Bacteroidota bacterium]MBT7144982.1 VWA domain-containing protein [Bacteroidota bacterium]MBT7492468.1 VWA domain-containing protein [Bacteroidota bacterium]
MKRHLFIILLLLAFGLKTKAQDTKTEPPLSRILFVFDGSQSMLGRWESDKKINIARKLLMKMVDSLAYIENLELALRVYGHQSYVPPQDCNDTKLEVPFGGNTASKIKQTLKYINPKGTTPIAHSLELAANDFPDCSECRNIIILITDGIESCDGDPCAVSLSLQKKGIVLKPFVIGIGLDMEFKETFECVGHYYDAANEEKFKEVLGIVITQALNSTTAQVNLLDIFGKPTETNVNMTFYDNFSGKFMHNYIHTINNRGNPDTLFLDPLVTYNMVAHTIPPVFIDSIKLTPGQHLVVATDAPQGYLILKSQSNLHRNLNFIVRQADSMKTLNLQKVNTEEKYIIGNYDLEILTSPRIYINDVEIKQSYTTKIEIPKPGIVTFLRSSQAFGSVYIEEDNRLKWILNLNPELKQETFYLQPGRYRVVMRAKHARESIYSNTKKFKVKSSGSQTIKLF